MRLHSRRAIAPTPASRVARASCSAHTAVLRFVQSGSLRFFPARTREPSCLGCLVFVGAHPAALQRAPLTRTESAEPPAQRTGKSCHQHRWRLSFVPPAASPGSAPPSTRRRRRRVWLRPSQPRSFSRGQSRCHDDARPSLALLNADVCSVGAVTYTCLSRAST